MKKILISVFAMALAAPVFAQPEQGQITLGGLVDATVVDGGHDLTIAPEVGYMLNDNFQLGLAIGFGNWKAGDEKETMIGAEIFGRYFMPIADKASFAVRGGLGYATLTESKTNMFGIDVSPEFWFHITPKTSFIASVGSIGYNAVKPDGGDSAGTFNLNWNTVDLGVVFTF